MTHQTIYSKLPDKQPALRVKPLPNDANAKGDIFGGWLMSQIDLAGFVIAGEIAKGPIATVAVKNLQFLQPVFIYDQVSFYADVVHIGTTSITVNVEVYAQRFQNLHEVFKVADATLVYVAVSEPGIKRQVPKA